MYADPARRSSVLKSFSLHLIARIVSYIVWLAIDPSRTQRNNEFAGLLPFLDDTKMALQCPIVVPVEPCLHQMLVMRYDRG